MVVTSIILAFLTGSCVVLSRTLNAKASMQTSLVTSTVMNFVTGLSGSILVFWLLRSKMDFSTLEFSIAEFPIWTGGLMGLIITFMVTALVTKLPAYVLTLLVFIGQVLAAFVIDYFVFSLFTPGKIIGGVIIAIGLLIARK